LHGKKDSDPNMNLRWDVERFKDERFGCRMDVEQKVDPR
jgi:hypothetical protein